MKSQVWLRCHNQTCSKVNLHGITRNTNHDKYITHNIRTGQRAELTHICQQEQQHQLPAVDKIMHRAAPGDGLLNKKDKMNRDSSDRQSGEDSGVRIYK